MEQRPQNRTSYAASRVTSLQHSIFILNNYLVHSSGKMSHFENYRYNYRPNIVGFGEIVLGDVRNIPTQKLRLRNQHQKPRGIWIGRGLITNEHITALPLQCSQHPSTTTGAYRCRQITRVPHEEQHDINFLKDIYWPQLSDDIDFNNREHCNNLQKQNITARDLQLQQSQDEEDIEQSQGVRPPVLRHHPQAVAPQQDQQPQLIQPPPGLPRPRQAVLPQPPTLKRTTSKSTGSSSTCPSSRTSSSRKTLQSSSWTSTESSQHH